MADVGTVRDTVRRLKSDGLPVSEYTLRRWVRMGKVPAASCGSKSLLYYPNVVKFIQCGQTAQLPAAEVNGIRRVEV